MSAVVMCSARIWGPRVTDWSCKNRGVLLEPDPRTPSRGHLPWCRIHAPSIVKARDAAKMERWNARMSKEVLRDARRVAANAIAVWALEHRAELPAEMQAMIARFEKLVS